MTVKELIEELKSYDENSKIMVCNHSDNGYVWDPFLTKKVWDNKNEIIVDDGEKKLKRHKDICVIWANQGY